MSIPNRFIDSFIVGTKIVTDKLSVRWYKPFSLEVKETVAMGYLPEEMVDWQGFRRDLEALEPCDKTQVIDKFERDWAPPAFAQYVVDTCLDTVTSKHLA